MSSASMPMPLVSGFVTFDDAPRVRVARPAPTPPAAVEREVAAPEAIARETVVAAPVAAAGAGMRQSPAWQPASSVRVRMVEGAIVAALCGWFLYGSVAVFGWV